MEEDPPPKPDNPAKPHTAAAPLRARGDSNSSNASSGSIVSTRTLQSIDLTTVTENDRTYPDEHYFMPCDAVEQDRLSILHRVYLAALGDKLTTAPITAATTRILDVGAGPGDWAVSISERFPYAEVVGIDLTIWDVEAVEAERQGGYGAGSERGVQWEIDDLNIWRADPLNPEQEPEMHIPSLTINTSNQKGKGKAPDLPSPTLSPSPPQADPPPTNLYSLEPQPPPPGWNFTEPFDYIHIRGLKGAFSSWSALYAEAYANLAPGGLIEVVDYSFAPPDTPNILNRPSNSNFREGPLPPPYAHPTLAPGGGLAPTTASSPNFEAFTHLFESTRLASLRAGINLGTLHLDTDMLRAAGFVEVRATQVNVPVGTWPSDARQKALGKLFVVCLMEGFESVCLRLLTRHAGWGKEEVREQVEKAKREVMRACVGEGEGEGEVEGWVAPFRWVVGRKGRGR
ncbi:uncharacterized protein BDZ99DRAFT_441723 [Mytilinidion resinicola]|uniref:S-adenosyl-L-methionine-dependent methyltransferase n=1 Tax=Mytilinidion resinicola TaxID=574789 RepID=A0A6A6YR69_9PEZI|nr:uncharacterized protein BDZ99DRAFT_441723 [Mytilinidion resinicola]KAF2811019.1 hypothetical protein BDZ99DRAFT_441723 [Mytilinidion resinicola]